MMIELDVSAPWEAPEASLRRGRPPSRLIAGLLLLGVLALTGGARATTSYDALYSVDGDPSVPSLIAESPDTPDHHRVTYGIAVDTGAVRWTLDSSSDTAVSFLYHDADYVGGLYGIAQLTADRVVHVHDPRTGEVVDTVRLQPDSA